MEGAHVGILDFFENCAQDFWCNVFGYFQLSSIFLKKLSSKIFFNIFLKLFWTDNQIVSFLYFLKICEILKFATESQRIPIF